MILPNLVQKGLAASIQKALDSVRVIGNEAVHPGRIDLKDDSTTAAGLFRLVNIIVEQTISNQKHIDEFFEKLPEAKKESHRKTRWQKGTLKFCSTPDHSAKA